MSRSFEPGVILACRAAYANDYGERPLGWTRSGLHKPWLCVVADLHMPWAPRLSEFDSSCKGLALTSKTLAWEMCGSASHGIESESSTVYNRFCWLLHNTVDLRQKRASTNNTGTTSPQPCLLPYRSQATSCCCIAHSESFSSVVSVGSPSC